MWNIVCIKLSSQCSRRLNALTMVATRVTTLTSIKLSVNKLVVGNALEHLTF